jgi:hypothetical protein
VVGSSAVLRLNFCAPKPARAQNPKPLTIPPNPTLIHIKMPIKELNNRQDISSDDKLNKLYTQFGELLKELRKRELSENIEKLINDACR